MYVIGLSNEDAVRVAVKHNRASYIVHSLYDSTRQGIAIELFMSPVHYNYELLYRLQFAESGLILLLISVSGEKFVQLCFVNL